MADLEAMCRALGDELRPLTTVPLPADPLTGVHISELLDPTVFLDGGELLLTAGLPLVEIGVDEVDAYVRRLVSRKVAALGLGLGAVYEESDRRLIDACERHGLPLLEIPIPTPFQLISRTYWSLVGKEETRELTSTLSAHFSLARAVTTKAPRQAVIQALAKAVEGWAAHMTASGEIVCVWPRDHTEVAAATRPHVRQVGDSGPASTSTFTLGSDIVHLQSLSSDDRVSGYLLCGRPEFFYPAQRHLIASAAMLLSVHGNRRRRRIERLSATRSDVFKLSLAGFDRAARYLRDSDSPGAAGVRVLAVSNLTAHERLELLDSVEATISTAHSPLPVVRDADAALVLVDSSDASAVMKATQSFLGRVTPHARAAMSAETILENLPNLTASLRKTLRTVTPGVVKDLGFADTLAADAADALQQLRAYTRADLVSAVAAYLATRGNWERAASKLGIHRNSMRNRITSAVDVTGLDLDDPDTASTLWLLLRDEGLA